MLSCVSHQAWKNEQLLGFSVKNMEELNRVSQLGINMVEVKVDKFAKTGWRLYSYQDHEFLPTADAKNLMIVCQLRGIAVQFHLPVENRISVDDELGLNMAFVEHHDILLQKFKMFEQIYRDTGLGRVLTIHPPLVSLRGKRIISEDESIKNTKIFFERLDRLRMKDDHKTMIGVENQADIKFKAGNLGNRSEHFKGMLKETRTIGLTIDTGHRKLAENFSMRGASMLGLSVVNFHFHGNSGIFNPKNWHDDEHRLPTAENDSLGSKAYKNFLRYFRRHRTPIVLEISHLEKYTDEELASFVANLKKELE